MESLDQQSLWEHNKKGLIKKITKNDDRTLVSNWIPINTLNVSYKILAKYMAMRVKHIHPMVIS